jgi:glycosyltransferase involved in cell wall biosynthesis
VLMPCRDASRFIGEALRSVLAAKTALEVLVQDGQSTDDTTDVVREFRDHRVKLVSEADQGQADALNRALARATGRWVLWLNADDLVSASAIDAVAPVLRSTDATLVYGDFSVVDGRGEHIRTYGAPPSWDAESLLYTGLRVFCGSIFFDRASLERWGGFDPRWHYCMDYELLIRVAGLARMEYAPQVIGSFRFHGASKSGTEPWRFFRECRAIHAQYVPPNSTARFRAAVSRGALAARLVATPLRYSRISSRLRPRKEHR